MNVEEKLKELILANYKSIRAFTVAASIPYSTVDNIFKRGIGGTAVTTVVRICDLLGITVEGITHGIIEPKENSAQLTPAQAKLLDSFDQLNEEGQTKVMDYAEDLCRTGYYKKCPASGLDAKEASKITALAVPKRLISIRRNHRCESG